jgi:hypothetical protein
MTYEDATSSDVINIEYIKNTLPKNASDKIAMHLAFEAMERNQKSNLI